MTRLLLVVVLVGVCVVPRHQCHQQHLHQSPPTLSSGGIHTTSPPQTRATSSPSTSPPPSTTSTPLIIPRITTSRPATPMVRPSMTTTTTRSAASMPPTRKLSREMFPPSLFNLKQLNALISLNQTFGGPTTAAPETTSSSGGSNVASTNLAVGQSSSSSSPSHRPSWWILGTRKNYAKVLDITADNYRTSCERVPFLGPTQRALCASHQNVLNAVGRGMRLSIEECQAQFRMNRWNCSTYADPGQGVFGPVLNINSREKAFLYAISSAGVVQSITKACSKGELAECGCVDNKASSSSSSSASSTSPDGSKGTWEWGGCSDDIHFGTEFSRKFIDSIEDGSTAEGMMNLHNNEVGRRIIKSKMELICKCHGVSGSCTIKVCWRKMKPFKEVGDMLAARFDGATEVKIIETGGKKQNGRKNNNNNNNKRRQRRMRPTQKNVKRPSKMDLVFLEESPDYCFKNASVGALGTSERICNATSYGLDGCRFMCCGRGYRTIERVAEVKCNCKFVWCCQVKCQWCKSKVIEHRCN